MDPHGEKQPQRRVEFKVALDAEVTPDEVPTMVAAAQATVDAATTVGWTRWRRPGVREGTRRGLLA